MNNLIIVRGLPGSGKSSLAELICGMTSRIKCFAADDYFYRDGKYMFDRNQLGRAHVWCKSQTAEALNSGYDVMVHNTFTTQSEINQYKKIAERVGAKFVSLIVENRHGNSSVHDVPDETVDKMRSRFVVDL